MREGSLITRILCSAGRRGKSTLLVRTCYRNRARVLEAASNFRLRLGGGSRGYREMDTVEIHRYITK